ncbi:hypothetical protein RB595_007540 [Gaeumannomyces hyphopodioides]
MAPVGSLLWRNLRIYQVYGANTDVGKTVLATLLCRAARALYSGEKTSFLKPVSTGPDDEADAHHVALHAPDVLSTTLLQYPQPVSPHAAARGRAPTDAKLLSLVHASCSRAATSGPGWLFLETAGGVHSPSPSGTTQADLYAALRLPVVLIGDAKLGGISLTISAFEALKMRGYDVESVLLFEDVVHQNAAYLKEYFGARFGVPVVGVDAPPLRQGTVQTDEERMRAYYARLGSGVRVGNIVKRLAERHAERVRRLESMSTTAYRKIWYPFTQQKLLRPSDITVIDSAKGDFFQTLATQATAAPSEARSLSAGAPNVPPSRDPRSSSAPAAAAATAAASSLLQPSFDGSASWWTQGLGHGSPSLTLAAAYAAGRYGHVMFAEAVHEPALALAETLLAGMSWAGNHRLTRVFYSDNGSTGIEVALKMALRAAGRRYGWGAPQGTTNATDGGPAKMGRAPKAEHVGVLALKGGYHGDTLGAMECAEPGSFNHKVDWYSGRGLWLDYATVSCVKGRWVVRLPEAMGTQTLPALEFETLHDIFDLARRKHGAEVAVYERYAEEKIRCYIDQGNKLGALVIEPVVIGAGGMLLVDPLFQHVLVNMVRRSAHLFGDSSTQPSSAADWTGLPVIFDEVFTGLYRLGTFTSSGLIQAHADISVHAKLLTGGLVPLAATLASESIFAAFTSTDKTDALLHGHSYTAHPVGCQVALESLRQFMRMESCGDGDRNNSTAKRSWIERPIEAAAQPGRCGEPAAWSIWPRGFVEEVSLAPSVAGVWALGTVLAIHMKSSDGVGYTSAAAVELRNLLREGTGTEDPITWNVHSRVLGNVLYLIGGQMTTGETVEIVTGKLRAVLAM